MKIPRTKHSAEASGLMDWWMNGLMDFWIDGWWMSGFWMMD